MTLRPEAGRWRIEWHSVLPSTMERARVLAETGAPAGTVVVADYQSAGRGTRGRIWLAPPGSCLMFTLIARPVIAAVRLEPLPRLVSESLALALSEAVGLHADVKPPNDLMVAGRKLCGVLCTSHLVGAQVAWVLTGIGLNTAMTRESRPLESATSLAIEGVPVPPHRELLDALLRRLEWLLEPDLAGALP